MKVHCFFKKLWIKEKKNNVYGEKKFKRGEFSEWTLLEYGFRLWGEGC